MNDEIRNIAIIAHVERFAYETPASGFLIAQGTGKASCSGCSSQESEL